MPGRARFATFVSTVSVATLLLAARAGATAATVPFLTEDAPLGSLARAFGFSVKPDVSSGRVTLLTARNRIVLAPGLARALVDGHGFPLLEPPRYVAGVLVVPPDLADLVRRLGDDSPAAGGPARPRPRPGKRPKVAVLPDAMRPARTLLAGGSGTRDAVADRPANAPRADRVRSAAGAAGFVVLDPGHGGMDAGARGRMGTNEKDVVLDMALRTAAHLRRAGVRVELTRTGDVYVSPAKRAAFANALAPDAFLSLHTNSFRKDTTTGVETWVLSPRIAEARGRERETGRRSRLLAGAVQKALIAALRDRDRGVREGNYTVLRESKVPVALAEIGFISNPDTEKRLTNARWRDRIARYIAKAVLASGVLVKRPG